MISIEKIKERRAQEKQAIDALKKEGIYENPWGFGGGLFMAAKEVDYFEFK